MKNIEIIVGGISEQRCMQQDEADTYDACITLIDSPEWWVRERKNHLIIYMEDTERVSQNAPNKEHVKQILDHVEKYVPENGKVFVHCMAGISRSTATAILLRVHFNGDNANEAVDKTAAQRPIMFPNMRILRLYDSMFRENFDDERIEDVAQEWRFVQQEKGLVIF